MRRNEAKIRNITRQERRRYKMEGPWFGGIIMLLMVVGLGVWIWWAMKQNKKE
jgi:hypothetical protein